MATNLAGNFKEFEKKKWGGAGGGGGGGSKKILGASMSRANTTHLVFSKYMPTQSLYKPKQC